jgi:hypothetical protein
MTKPVWRGRSLKELLRRGALGEEFPAIARDYGRTPNSAERRFREHAPLELQMQRNEARGARQRRPPNGESWGLVAGANPFTGQCFVDDFRAIRDVGSPGRLPSPDLQYSPTITALGPLYAR